MISGQVRLGLSFACVCVMMYTNLLIFLYIIKAQKLKIYFILLFGMKVTLYRASI